MPLVSVLIVSHNRFEMLQKCLESLRNQHYRNFEVILIDDGSTDKTKSLRRFVDAYRYQKNKGISAARNKALDIMKGKYFFVLDSDDKLTQSCLQEHVELIEQTNSDFVFSYYEYFGEGVKDGGIVEYYPQTFKECFKIKKIPHAGLYRASTLWKFRYDESLASAVDYDYILKILSEFPKIKMHVIRKPLYKYRINHVQQRDTPAQITSMGIIKDKYKHLL